jgi:tetratricopeptide (TPR) repeat protein
LALVLVTLAVYSQVWHFDFLNFDDPDYVTDNSHVRAGLTWDGVAWAFTSFHAANWFPLTWISHMVDSQLFGVRSGWHHLSNVVLHALASIFLFAAFKRMTRAHWPSAFVAFLFALHPLHVESVAWVAERKDVLCALFWFLALWLYARYAEQPGAGRYLLVLVAFCLGLMAKPMIVTLPFVLLLLDVWPLRRANRLAILWEKLPFFALAAGASLVTYLAQHQGGAVRSLDTTSFGLRVANALVTYVTYVARMFWPTSLAVFYPYSHELGAWRVALAVIVLTGATVLVVRQVRTHPYLAIGWLWYLGTLVPVIGIVQVGGQSSADRYTYVPMVGLAIMLSWAAVDLVKRFPGARTALTASAAVVCVACVALTWHQLRFWANSESLFQHAVNVTVDNHIAHNNLASYYLTQKQNEEALNHIYEALRIKPSYPEAHVNLATVLRRMGNNGGSEREYQTALNLQPANVEAHSGLGALFVAEGRLPDALREFQTAVALNPEYADGHYSLGRVLAALGRGNEAMAEYGEAVRLRPDHADARRSLGMALLSEGRFGEALAAYSAAAKSAPADAGVHNDLGTMLASAGRLDEAIAQFSEALRINPEFAEARSHLAAALARRDRARTR